MTKNTTLIIGELSGVWLQNVALGNTDYKNCALKLITIISKTRPTSETETTFEIITKLVFFEGFILSIRGNNSYVNVIHAFHCVQIIVYSGGRAEMSNFINNF